MQVCSNNDPKGGIGFTMGVYIFDIMMLGIGLDNNGGGLNYSS